MPRAEWALKSETPAAWASCVAEKPIELLSDHAQCELKAAASAMTLLKRNPDRPGLALRIAPLIKEEVDHLQRVLRLLEQRNATLGRDRHNPYVAGLMRFSERTRSKEEGHLDALLVSALIEKRSHERFERLSDCPALAELSDLYTGLGEAEQRHGDLFVELALEVHAESRVRARYDELATFEAEHIGGLPFDYRIHSGPPA